MSDKQLNVGEELISRLKNLNDNIDSILEQVEKIIMRDLEKDLIENHTILSKCKISDVYAQNLYAALCNNRFFYNDETWTCSWRMAGGIIADMRQDGDYMDWYCSGLSNSEGFVGEGTVTDEIRMDLMRIGWTIKPYETTIREKDGA